MVPTINRAKYCTIFDRDGIDAALAALFEDVGYTGTPKTGTPSSGNEYYFSCNGLGDARLGGAHFLGSDLGLGETELDAKINYLDKLLFPTRHSGNKDYLTAIGVRNPHETENDIRYIQRLDSREQGSQVSIVDIKERRACLALFE